MPRGIGAGRPNQADLWNALSQAAQDWLVNVAGVRPENPLGGSGIHNTPGVEDGRLVMYAPASTPQGVNEPPAELRSKYYHLTTKPSAGEWQEPHVTYNSDGTVASAGYDPGNRWVDKDGTIWTSADQPAASLEERVGVLEGKVEALRVLA